MRRHLVLLIVPAAVAFFGPTTARAASWIFRPGAYSHDPATGQRVTQYAPNAPSLAPIDPTYLQSGYRHIRKTINFGGSADRLHIVQTWGLGELIRPYGEWQRPFRAGATPYGPWGNPRGPWTMPFDSWSNPYGQWNRWGNPHPYPYPRLGGGGRSGAYSSPYGSPQGMPSGAAHGSPRGAPHGP